MNVQMEVRGTQLVLTIDISDKLKKSAPLSSSGKTRVVSTTSGFIAIPDTDVKVGLNVICPK